MAGVDHKVRAGAFFRVRHLLGKDRVERRLGHARARQHAGALDLGRGGDDGDPVEPFVGAGLEEKRDIADSEPGACSPGIGQEGFPVLRHQRVDRCLDLRKQARLGQDCRPQPAPVDAFRTDGIASKLGDLAHAGAFRSVKPVHRRIRAPGREAKIGEDGERGRFAHADRSGEAEHDHAASRTARRSAGVTVTSRPNQARKPGRAW